MSASVAEIISSQSALSQTTSHTLSFTPSSSGLYRVSAYMDVAFVGGDSWTNLLGWTDDHNTNSLSLSGTSLVTGSHDKLLYSVIVKATSGNAITLAFTITAGSPSADMYLVVEEL